MQKKKRKRIWSIHRKQKQSIETVPKDVQTLDLLDRDFKSAVLNKYRVKVKHV